jgi:hypothetical protein
MLFAHNADPVIVSKISFQRFLKKKTKENKKVDGSYFFCFLYSPRFTEYNIIIKRNPRVEGSLLKILK